MTKYFQTYINYGWRKGESFDQDSPRHLVYCKAIKNEETWIVSIVSPHVKNPYILYMMDVMEDFFIGSEITTKEIYEQQHQLISKLTNW